MVPLSSLCSLQAYLTNSRVRDGEQESDFLYTGKEKDGTGPYYYEARYYDPFLMHFTQPDENIPDVYNPQDLNRYSYVRNNPYTYVDPSGERAELVTRGLNYQNPFNFFVSPVAYTIAQSSQIGAHSYFDISPDNPADFGGATNFQLGASKQNGILQPRVSQETCSANVIEYSRVPLTTPQGKTDTQFINALYSEANKIGQVKVPYFAIPELKAGTANSNTFARTVIENTGSGLPQGTSYTNLAPFGVQHPGIKQTINYNVGNTQKNQAQTSRSTSFKNFFNRIKSKLRGRGGS